jgi:hypothetical protein
MNLREPTSEQKAKASGFVGIIHIIAGSSILVKTIIVSVALAAGYGSVLYFKGDNAISNVAEEIVQNETGVDVHFNQKN